MRRALLAALLSTGCGPTPAPIHEIVVCDRTAECDTRLVRLAADEFLGGSPPPGSRFEVLVPGCDVGDALVVYEVLVPRSWGSGVAAKKKSWRTVEALRLDALTLPPAGRCSGIAAAIWRTGRLLADDARSVKRLRIVSNLREVSPALGVNFERKIPRAKNFVALLRDASLVATLANVSLEACGVTDRGTANAPRWSARKSRRLRAAWSGAFSAMGQPGLAFHDRCSFENQPAHSRNTDKE